MNDVLSRGERLQLGAARALNTVGWTLAAVAVTWLVLTAGNVLTQRVAEEPGLAALRPVDGAIAPAFTFVAALAIGGICGAKLWRDQVRQAVVLSAFLILLPGLFDLVDLEARGLAAVAAVPLAGAWARRVASQRRL